MTTGLAVRETPLLIKESLAKQVWLGFKTETRRPFERRRPDPFGGRRDLIWLRNTWYHHLPCQTDKSNEQAYDPVTRIVRWKSGHVIKDCAPILSNPRWKKRPSMHMYRWASCITLEILEASIQPLHNITEAEAKAEGVKLPATAEGCPPGKAKVLVNLCSPYILSHLPPGNNVGPLDDHFYRIQFAVLWDELYGNGRHAWKKNPNVWVIRFKKVEDPK